MPSSYSAVLLKNAEAFSEGHEQHWLLRQQARASFPSAFYCKKHHREISWSSLLSLRLELDRPKICTGCSYGATKNHVAQPAHRRYRAYIPYMVKKNVSPQKVVIFVATVKIILVYHLIAIR